MGIYQENIFNKLFYNLSKDKKMKIIKYLTKQGMDIKEIGCLF